VHAWPITNCQAGGLCARRHWLLPDIAIGDEHCYAVRVDVRSRVPMRQSVGIASTKSYNSLRVAVNFDSEPAEVWRFAGRHNEIEYGIHGIEDIVVTRNGRACVYFPRTTPHQAYGIAWR